MKIGWIGGWGISLEELRPIAVAHAPEAQHLIYPPVLGAAENLVTCDAVIGWSLGAHLLYEAAARGVKLPARALLIAPFTSFGSEHGKCGKVSESQVRWLRRWLEKEPLTALADFRHRAGLPLMPEAKLPYELGHLLAGLDLLAEPAGISLISYARQGLPQGWEAFVGSEDSLLNPEGVCQSIQGCQIIDGLGHHLPDFLNSPSSL
jgi:hypothetical protein